MAYPVDPLGVRLRIAPNADLTALPSTYAWEDITKDWRPTTPIVLTVGAADEQSETNCELTFDLRNMASRTTGAGAGIQGRYTSDNPMSDLWPNFDRGLPVELAIDPGTGFEVRTVQYVGSCVDEWPGRTQHFAVTHVECGGLMRRLVQGRNAKSAMQRTYLSPSNPAPPLAYWSMERAEEARSLTMGIPSEMADVPAIKVNAPGLKLGTVEGPPGSARVPLIPVSTTKPEEASTTEVPGTGLRSTLPASTAGFWSVTFSFKGFLPNGASADAPIDWDAISVLMSGGGRIRVTPYSSWNAGVRGATFGVDILGLASSFFGDPTLDPFDGEWHHIHARQTQSGGNIVTSLYVDGRLMHSTSAAGTLGTPVSWNGPKGLPATLDGIDSSNAGSAVSIGHIAFHDQAIDVAADYLAFTGYVGEMAHVRAERVCSEEQIPFSTAGTTSEAMGVQAFVDVAAILRDCALVGRAILDDSMGLIEFRTAAELYNQASALTIDGTNRQLFFPFVPTADDQKTRNDVRVTDGAGGVARVTDDAHIARYGRYDGQETVNVADEGQLPGQAGQRVREGTVAGKRYPSVTVDMLRAPTLIASWLALRAGDKITVTNPPLQHSKGDIDLMARGWTETIVGRRKGWSALVNSVRYEPWEAFTIESGAGNRSRLDTAGSVLVDARDTVQTALTVFEPGDGVLPPNRWVDDVGYPSSFPFDVNCGGERLTVTSIADIIRDEFSRDTVAGFGTPTIGAAWTLGGSAADFQTIALPFGRGIITPSSVNADRTAFIASGSPDNIVRVDVRFNTTPATGLLNAGAFVRYLDGSNFYSIRAALGVSGALTCRFTKRIAGAQTLVSAVTVVPDIPITTSTWLVLEGWAIGSNIRAKLWVRDRTIASGASSTYRQKALWDIDVTDTSLATGSNVGIFARNETAVTTHELWFDHFVLVSPQAWTVTRSVNGIVKSLPAGSDVRLWRPGAYSL